MTFHAAALISFAVYELTGFIIPCVMAHSATAIFKTYGMVFMGKTDLRPSQAAEYIFVGQNVYFFLGHRWLPPDCAHYNRTNYDG